MLLTTTTEGAAAVVTPCGDITYDALPRLVAARRTLPATITDVTWDLHQASFMDVIGLRLLADQRTICRRAGQHLAVTGLQDQPLRLLRLAQELFPEDRWTDFLPYHAPVTA